MTVLPRRSFSDTSLPFSSCKVNSGALSWIFMGISVVRSGWGRVNAAPQACDPHAPARHWLRTILYRGMLFTLLAAFVGGGILSQAQEERPEFIPGERKVPRKKDASPRALAVLQMTANGKVTLVPVAILINGKFWDASVYKADPVPMALETGTVYEGERTGSSVGLFTIGSALHSLAVNAQVPWIGTGSWLAEGKDAPNKPLKAEGVPVGIDNSDAPPRLTKDGSSSGSKPTANNAPSSSSSPSGSTSSSPSSSSGSSSSGDEPPRLSRPAQSSGSGSSGPTPTSSSPSTTQSAPNSSTPSSNPSSSPPNASTPNSSTPNSSTPASPSDGKSSADKSSSDKSSSDKSSDEKPTLKRPDQTPDQNPKQDKSKQSAANKTSSEPEPAASDSGAAPGYRPRLRRGKPATSFADEDVPGYGKLGAGKPSAKSGATASASTKASASESAQEIIDLVPAISDATSNELHAYNFIWLKDEEDERRKQIEGIAKQEVTAYLNAQARATTLPTPASAKPGAKTSAHTAAKKAPEPVLENVKMVAYDLWGNNTPVIVFSANAHMPPKPAGAAQSGISDMQYSVMLVMRPDIYDTLRQLYVGVTDKFHLDITPRLQLIDAVDADGDGRGELLFKEVSDAGAGWILYRASADKLWKMFDSLSPE